MLPSLVVFARSPARGRVKTRLAPLLTEDGASRLYRAFLEDAARAYLEPAAWEAVLAAEPDPEDPILVRIFQPPWRREPQAHGDLGARLARAFESRFAEGSPAVVVVGSDHPDLPKRLLRESFARLAEGMPAVLIPADDGGYCAIGLTRSAPVREAMRAIPWSSPSVLSVTLERLRRSGVAAAVLETCYDVDRPEDIARLRRDLASRDPAADDYPRATASALESLT